jgi:hypothetical protein
MTSKSAKLAKMFLQFNDQHVGLPLNQAFEKLQIGIMMLLYAKRIQCTDASRASRSRGLVVALLSPASQLSRPFLSKFSEGVSWNEN